MRFSFVEQIEGLVKSPDAVGVEPSVLIITKTGKYLRGHIIDHNVRINSDGRVRGRIVLQTGTEKKDVDANDIGSLEAIPKKI